MSGSKLEPQFDLAMEGIYRRAFDEASYRATRFLEMLHEHRGVKTARMLIHSQKVSEGYTALWMKGRLDLTVEALIHDNPEWHPLFEANELETCRKRLADYHYFKANQPTGS